MDLVHIFLPKDVFEPIGCYVLQRAVSPTPAVTVGCPHNGLLGHVYCLVPVHIPLVLGVQDALREGAPAALAEEFALQAPHSLPAVEHLEVHALVVEAADETPDAHA